MQIEVKLDAPGTVMRSFLGWHDLIVRFPDGRRHGFVGRGSMSVVAKLDYWQNIPADAPDHLFTVGRFCEFAGCKILLAGEHENDKQINTVFGDTPLFLAYIKQVKKKDFSAHFPGFFEMGNGVVVSHGAILLGGNNIGDGVVIGAGAVVPKSIEPYRVVVGSPPIIKPRKMEDSQYLNHDAWWEYSMDDISCLLLEDLSSFTGKRLKMGEEPKVVVQMREEVAGSRLLSIQEIVGFQTGEEFVSFGKAPTPLQTYFRQMERAFKGEAVKLDSKILNKYFS